MILRYIILTLLIFNTNVILSQKNGTLNIKVDNVHEFIYQIYENQAKDFYINNPTEVNEMINFLKHNVHFVQFKEIPVSVVSKLSDFEPLNRKHIQNKFNPLQFNPFLYQFELIERPTKIHIDDTNYVLFINPTIPK